MSRIRTIKPDFFKDEHVADLEPEAQLLFIGLWTLADRNGILEDRPRWIRAELFPYKPDFDIDNALLALARAGMCVRYVAQDGSELIHITNFLKHQRPNSREPVSNYPLPEKGQIKPLAYARTRTHAHAQEEGEGKGREGEGKGITPLSGKPDVAEEIFAYWKAELNHPNSRLDGKRRKAITARLKEGYTPERIQQAIRGIKKSSHHMGQNDRGTVYDDIELICRSGANVDKFADTETMKPRFQGQERYEKALLGGGE